MALVSRLPSAVVELGAAHAPERAAPTDLERAALAGERSAWNALVELHGRRVVLSLLAAGVPPAQAREFAQDAWLRLMQQAAQGRLTWLQLPGLVVRQALFLARAAARRPSPVDTAGAPPAEADSVEETYFARERLLRARERVEALAPGARAVFLLLYGEPGLSHAEVAGRVGLSVQRVRQIICEVRKTLRAELEEETSDVQPPHP